MKKLLLGILAITMVAGATAFAFEDIKGNAYEKEIVELNNWGYVDGYEDGTFKPEESLTRAEAARIVVNAIYPDYEILGTIKDFDEFSDVNSDHWAYTAISYLKGKRIIEGFTDNTFRPDEAITEAQMINICLKITGYQHLVEINSEPWYRGVIDTATKYAFLEGTEIIPDEYINRGKFAKLLHNTINIPIVEVIGWTTNLSTGPKAEIKIADGKDSGELKTLLLTKMTSEKAGVETEESKNDIPRFNGEEYTCRVVKIQELEKAGDYYKFKNAENKTDNSTYILTPDTYVDVNDATVELKKIKNDMYANCWYYTDDTVEIELLKIEILKADPIFINQ